MVQRGGNPGVFHHRFAFDVVRNMIFHKHEVSGNTSNASQPKRKQVVKPQEREVKVGKVSSSAEKRIRIKENREISLCLNL